MALLLSGEENQGPASDAYEVCVCKGWAEGRTVTAAGLEALKPYKVRNAVIMGVSGFLCLGRLFQGQPNEAALCI